MDDCSRPIFFADPEKMAAMMDTAAMFWAYGLGIMSGLLGWMGTSLFRGGSHA
jgi:hypothetical protein